MQTVMNILNSMTLQETLDCSDWCSYTGTDLTKMYLEAHERDSTIKMGENGLSLF